MGDVNPCLVLAPVLGLASSVVFHLLLARWVLKSRAFRSVLWGLMGGAIVSLSTTVVALGKTGNMEGIERIACFGFNGVIFACLGICYFSVACLSITSLRIRVLQEFLGQEKGLSRQQILQRYDGRMFMANRISRLTAGRQLIEKDGRFYNGRSGVLWIARAVYLLKFVILGRRRSGQVDKPHRSAAA